MDFAELERRILSLEQSLDSFEFWLAFSTLMVVVGLVLEYWYDVKRLVQERPFHWRALQEILGALLVTAGVAGELLIQFRASKIETDLRSTNHKVETLLRTAAAESIEKAGHANAEAAEANARARQFEGNIAEARKDAATARRDAESFRLQIATANERAARNEKEAVQLRKAAEDERLARVKIEEKLADRRLTETQIARIARSLKRFSGQDFQVTTYWDLKEPMTLTNG